MTKPTKTIDEIIITHLQRVAKPFTTRRSKVEKWYTKQLFAAYAKRSAALEEIDSMESAELDAILAGHTADKADTLLIAAGLRVDAGIEAVSPIEGDDEDVCDELTDEGCFPHG